MLSVLTNFNSDGGADNETGMELDETRSEHLDMLKDNERSERALKSSEKTPKGRNVASSSSKTEKNQQKALSTTKMNGNEKPKKRAEVNIFLSFHGSITITKIKSVLIKTNFKFCAFYSIYFVYSTFSPRTFTRLHISNRSAFWMLTSLNFGLNTLRRLRIKILHAWPQPLFRRKMVKV